MNKRLIFQGRRSGKSVAADRAKELLLDAGRPVIVIDRNRATRYTRKKHLTCSEVLQDFNPKGNE